MYVNINNINFKYKNSKENIINNFSLQIEKGKIVAILGQSGSGKSTILRIISGLENPYSGSIEIDGKVMKDKNIDVPPEKRGIGMVFQDYALFPHLKVKDNIKYGLLKKDKKEKEKIMEEMLELVEMKEHKDKYPHELSGGQQQRVALARALAPKPSILLLDEPFSNLDANLREQIRSDLKSIIHKANITSIFVTHDKEDAKVLADQIVILEKGKTISKGKVAEIL